MAINYIIDKVRNMNKNRLGYDHTLINSFNLLKDAINNNDDKISYKLNEKINELTLYVEQLQQTVETQSSVTLQIAQNDQNYELVLLNTDLLQSTNQLKFLKLLNNETVENFALSTGIITTNVDVTLDNTIIQDSRNSIIQYVPSQLIRKNDNTFNGDVYQINQLGKYIVLLGATLKISGKNININSCSSGNNKLNGHVKLYLYNVANSKQIGNYDDNIKITPSTLNTTHKISVYFQISINTAPLKFAIGTNTVINNYETVENLSIILTDVSVNVIALN